MFTLPNHPTSPRFFCFFFYLVLVLERSAKRCILWKFVNHPVQAEVSPSFLNFISLSWVLFLRRLLSSSQTTILILWKHDEILLVLKHTDLSDSNNYRPASPSSVIFEVFETVISDQLRSFPGRERLLSDCQYEFRFRHSTGDLPADSCLIFPVGCTRKPRRNTPGLARYLYDFWWSSAQRSSGEADHVRVFLGSRIVDVKPPQ